MGKKIQLQFSLSYFTHLMSNMAANNVDSLDKFSLKDRYSAQIIFT